MSNKRIVLLSTLTAAGMFGPSAFAADKATIGGQDWKDVAPPQAPQTALGSGGFPGSFLIPGTNTSFRIGGYVKADVIKDFSKNAGDFISWPRIPTFADGVQNNRTGDVRLHARQSRFNIETRTPTDYGELKTYIEGDFFGTSGSANFQTTNNTTFQVRHAYGELGPFLAGQTWSLAMDLDSAPETIDFGGPAGFVFIRQAQVRYTYNAGWLTVAGSIENPEGDFLGKGTAANPTANNAVPDQATGGASLAGTNVSPNVINRLPDFVGKVQARGPFGELSAYGIARRITADTGIVHASTFGYQVGAAGQLYTFGKDNVRFEANWGRGGGRYINNFNGQAAAWDGKNLIEAQNNYGGYLYYQHWWTDKLRTNLGAGEGRVFNRVSIIGPVANGGQNPTRWAWGSHVNLIWSPVGNTNFGIEFAHGQREEETRAKGDINRFQFGAQFLF